MPIDVFKNIDEIFEPNIKRATSFEEYYHKIAEIILVDTVPLEIRLHFDIAKNLMLYSWFVNRFRHVSELHAFSSVEFAIRTKIEIVTNDKCKIKNLKPLLNHAIEKKWIIDDGFPKVVERKKRQKEFQDMFENELELVISKNEVTDLQQHSKLLMNTFPTLRNLFAHGSNNILPSYLDILDSCRHLINQLFN